jgi:hypothetical protein
MLSLTLTCLLAPILPPQSPSLLAAVPDDATVIARCADVGLLRDRMERNRWAQFLQTHTGNDLLLRFLLGGNSNDEFGKMAEIGSAMHGECVMFSSEAVTGLLTAPPTNGEALKSALQALMPEISEGYNHASQMMFGAHVDILVSDRSESSGANALVHHPMVFGLFKASNGEDLLAGLKSSLSGLATDHRAPAAHALEARRSQVGRHGLVEFYADGSESFCMMADDFTPDEVSLSRQQLLGDGTLDLYLSLDMQPGTQMEMRALLNVPPGTLASRFADCMRPLPPGLADSIPNDSMAFTGFGLDLAAGFDLGRKVLAELKAEQVLNTVEQGLAAGTAITGVDLEKAVIRQLTGPMALVFLDPGEATEFSDVFDLPFFFMQGVGSGVQFQDAFEELVPLGEEFIQLDLSDIHGVDVYQAADEDIGIAFLPNAFVLAMNNDALVRAVTAGVGKEESREPGPISATLMANPGVCGLGSTVMSPFWGAMLDEDEEALGLLEGAQITSTLRRVRTGFELLLVAH